MKWSPFTGRIAEVRKQLTKSCVIAYRGVAPRFHRAHDGTRFATDAGYYGRGLYYSTKKDIAEFYSGGSRRVSERCLSFKHPLVLSVDQAKKMAKKEGTVDAEGYPLRSEEATLAADRLTRRLQRKGYDGVAIVHRGGSVELLDINPPADLEGSRRRRR